MHPFTDNPQARIGRLGEAQLLEMIRQALGPSNPPSPAGMGDDAAVLNERGNLLCVDSLVYGRHFDDAVSPEAAGAKLLKRNLSDTAAMGGRPLQAVIALFLPPATDSTWLRRFTQGLSEAARAYPTLLVGGDLTETDRFLGGSLTLTGQAERPLCRTGAKCGDTLWVTGSLGGSRLGRHLDFTPRLAEGQYLAKQPSVHSCIDLSDGLAKDLPELLPAGCSAFLDTETIPLSAAAIATSKTSRTPALRYALSDGEDYELLFTVCGDIRPADFQNDWQAAFAETPLSCIGHIAEGERQLIDAHTGRALALNTSGYVHFG